MLYWLAVTYVRYRRWWKWQMKWPIWCTKWCFAFHGQWKLLLIKNESMLVGMRKVSTYQMQSMMLSWGSIILTIWGLLPSRTQVVDILLHLLETQQLHQQPMEHNKHLWWICKRKKVKKRKGWRKRTAKTRETAVHQMILPEVQWNISLLVNWSQLQKGIYFGCFAEDASTQREWIMCSCTRWIHGDCIDNDDVDIEKSALCPLCSHFCWNICIPLSCKLYFNAAQFLHIRISWILAWYFFKYCKLQQYTSNPKILFAQIYTTQVLKNANN